MNKWSGRRHETCNCRRRSFRGTKEARTAPPVGRQLQVIAESGGNFRRSQCAIF